ncbi:DsbA family protein, partial [Klebsiella pneumoniae]|uniref:DsbA family protein n=1 Tax=Klebsiella pneumoniae TaxID=573 RepID=UPI00200D2484
EQLGVGASSLGDATVKDALRASTEAALAAGVFGVPTLIVNGERYFGQDATPFALAALARPQNFQEGEYARVAALPVGVQRR